MEARHSSSADEIEAGEFYEDSELPVLQQHEHGVWTAPLPLLEVSPASPLSEADFPPQQLSAAFSSSASHRFSASSAMTQAPIGIKMGSVARSAAVAALPFERRWRAGPPPRGPFIPGTLPSTRCPHAPPPPPPFEVPSAAEHPDARVQVHQPIYQVPPISVVDETDGDVETAPTPDGGDPDLEPMSPPSGSLGDGGSAAAPKKKKKEKDKEKGKKKKLNKSQTSDSSDSQAPPPAERAEVVGQVAASEAACAPAAVAAAVPPIMKCDASMQAEDFVSQPAATDRPADAPLRKGPPAEPAVKTEAPVASAPEPAPTPRVERLQILILFYSMFGYVAKLAAAVADGCIADDVDVRLRRIPELLSPQALTEVHADRCDFHYIPDIKPPELASYHCIIFGFPTRFGIASFQVQQFLEEVEDSCRAGLLEGKVGGVFTASASQHGGQESTCLNFLRYLLDQGMLVVGPPPYAVSSIPASEVHGGGPYGASTISGPLGQRPPSSVDLSVARAQGAFTASVARRLFLGTHVAA